ncbi:hypothetical protein PMIN01_13380 [Paraphaeosphaeria minitans]|uniref:Uncharacterized protein n=1 Tax=Paraphaeosphaeria minitans TaxID=565426 RepID=A0A9P6G3S7_9PLEO|nr:hypothetical protein PMIN01_13380 [Paraphaeosphaeria minitans]
MPLLQTNTLSTSGGITGASLTPTPASPPPSLRNSSYREDLKSRDHRAVPGRARGSMGESSNLNGMLLRADLHQSFDADALMQKLVGIDRRCLFARVTWAVLSLLHDFLSIRRLASNNLLVRMKGGELKEIAPGMFQQFSRWRSRNRSSTKRPRLEALEEDDGSGQDKFPRIP